MDELLQSTEQAVKMRRIILCWTSILVAGCLLTFRMSSKAYGQGLKPAPPELVKILREDTTHSVGKVLPSGITVLDFQQHKRDLRTELDALHSPVILVIVSATHCPPCDRLVKYANNRDFREAKRRASVVFLQVNYKAGMAPLALPSSVTVFHTTKALSSGYLAVHRYPETFYFNSGLKLIKRHVGLGAPWHLLTYPKNAQH
ncbi:MAG TPA: hypothetical protein VFL78_03025 [Rhodanobacteraceae bacterium]|nr:hypothetical protein [Rhodanobacteraceae bacterium]